MTFSRLYTALLRHERSTTASHAFTYKVPVFVFDLAELDHDRLENVLFARHRASGKAQRCSRARHRLLSVEESDYLYPGPQSLRTKLARALSAGGLEPELAWQRVWLVTSARFCGRIFNPVNFWIITGGARPASCLAVVVEVNNTFGEKHLYVLGDGAEQPFPARFSAPKRFHVSPFNDMQGDYVFLIGDPEWGVDICIDLQRDERRVLQARLWSEARGRPVRSLPLAAFLLHPHRVLTYPRILRQAASLYFRRRLPVHRKPEPSSPMTIRTASRGRPDLMARLMRRILSLVLRNIRFGRLHLIHPDQTEERFEGSQQGPDVCLRVTDNRFYRRLAASADIGFGEAYTEGWWETSELTEVIRFFILNREQIRLSQTLHLPDRLVAFAGKLRRLGGRRNTRSGARDNILAHYDLGDTLFATFLDPSMAYSCAWFERPDFSLSEAQEAKYRRVCERLELKPGDRVLEIGCGWGGFALFAARHYGCRVDGVTISDNQYSFACNAARDLGLTHLVAFYRMDYRDIENRYDKIVSIEMFEAVGHAYHKAFFAALDRLLVPEGQVFLQFIAIYDQRYEAYLREGDWIRKHIFPGGLLPSLARTLEAMRDASGFTVRWLDAIGPHYARTLHLWRDNFLACSDKLEALGYDAVFRRTWALYFAYCEAGFATRVIDDYQMLLARPEGTAPKSR
ncbi:DUF1365 family protein [Desulfohalobium retbaense]|uniref:Cyclopropane-fatty-acyl-phospholipid synthase n=1 Tax=Desulfohalobium retbaense (strain ATCC 49708 / DSM 5692 / JCM 16813 / HR100) TaxID=485915 RepID=C8X1V4_DESRD|nr:DUF1365 family protein [Desulfohalobium retbaense]ACV68526.1 Cyclopropane-fatty-acyl-phospholipid synthase [Desulfohalobium retbaense DSM 5692]